MVSRLLRQSSSRRILPLAALLLASSPQAWANWHSVGAMPPAVRRANGVEYRNPQGLVRIYVLSPGVIRVRFLPAALLPAADRQLPGGLPLRLGRDHSFAVTSPPPPRTSFQFQPGPATDRLTTSQLQLLILRNPFRLTFLDSAGHILDQDTAAQGMAYAGARVRVWKQLSDADHFFGFGEKTGPLDKRNLKLGGVAYAMWNSDVFGYGDATDPLYSDIPFFLVLRNGMAHGIFFDNTWRSWFNIGHSSPDRFSFGAEGGALNYYLIAGPSPRLVLRRYSRLTGRMPLPPLWVLGYNQCRYSYAPAAKVLSIAQGFRQRHIPADVLWLDIAYMRGYRVFTWSPRRFPHPRRMLAQLHAEGYHVVTIIDPGVKVDPGYRAYASGLRQNVFVRYPDGSLYVGPVWPGPAAFPDFTSAAARAWWARRIAGFASAGVDGIWNDMNEPSVFNTPSGTMPDQVMFSNAGRPGSNAEDHNVFGQQMSRATRRGLLGLRPNLRPFVLTRSTYAGGQRYAALWTGDNRADWVHLRHGVTTLLGMGISGFPFVGNDIGGFAGAGSARLWTRWVEAGAFFPFMRAHADIQDPPKEPWVYGPRFTAYNRRAIKRRYQFLPYIYNSFYRSSQDGMPMMRALMLEYPQDPQTYTLSNEFLFGRDLLVAPVLRAHRRQRSVYLPRGNWYALHSGQVFTGPATITARAGLGQIPLYAREGAVLFRAPVMQTTAAWATAPLIYDIYARQATRRQYYEDDGATLAYENDGFFLRRIIAAPENGGWRITLTGAQGTYRPRHVVNELWLHGTARPQAVLLNGAALSHLAGEPGSAAHPQRVPLGWWYAPGSARQASALRIVIPQSPFQQIVQVIAAAPATSPAPPPDGP